MIITNEMYNKACKSAIYAIQKVLPVSNYEYYIAYNGRGLEISAKNIKEETRIYCRIVYTHYGFLVDLSNINLDKSIRRKGKFTSILAELKKSKTLAGVMVSSVLTNEMHMACKANNMEYDESILGYKLIFRYAL